MSGTDAVTRGQLVPMTPMRRAIARRMTESKQQAPHFYVSTEIGMDAVLVAVERLNAESDERVTVSAFLVRACALALTEHPGFNAVWTDAGLEEVDAVNVCVAVALEGGLIAPAILDAGTLDLRATAAALRDVSGRARGGKLRAAEVNEGTFTLSNLGMFEVSAFTAIVTPPQVAILATGKTERLPRAAGEEVVLRSVMTATLSADHRAVDGADAARFLGTVKAMLEDPTALLEEVG